MNSVKTFRWTSLLATLVVTSVALAGCMGAGEKRDQANEAPEAKLETGGDKTMGWTTEQFTFRGEGSRDPDGNITRWVFDFGDGTKEEKTRTEEPEARHTYLHGGEYTVTLTVTDDGGENAGALTDTDTLQIAVNERRDVAGGVIYAGPTNTTQQATYKQEFETFDGADRFELDVTVQSVVLAGGSTIRVRVLDPEGDVLDEDEVTVNAAQTDSINLDGVIRDKGGHMIEIVAESGGASVTGQLRVYYDKDFQAE